MDIYNDAADWELNESEVDEILGLEREREILEPEEMPEEEVASGEEDDEEREESEKEESEPAFAPARRGGKKMPKRIVRTAGSADEKEEGVLWEQNVDKTGGNRGTFQRIPLGDIPQLRNAIELPLPKVNSYDAAGNVFIGGRILAQSEEVFSSYQDDAMGRRQGEMGNFEARDFKREIQGEEIQSQESYNGKEGQDEGETGNNFNDSVIGVERGVSRVSGVDESGDASRTFGMSGIRDVSKDFDMAVHGMVSRVSDAAVFEKVSRDSGGNVFGGVSRTSGTGGFEDVSKDSELDAFGDISRASREAVLGDASIGSGRPIIGNISRCFGMAAPAVEKALANPRSRLYVSLPDGGMFGIKGTGGNVAEQGAVEGQADGEKIDGKSVGKGEKIEEKAAGGSAENAGINIAVDVQDSLLPEESRRKKFGSRKEKKQPGIYSLEGLGSISEQGGRLVFRFVSGDVRDERTAEQKGKEALIRRAAFAAATMDTLAAGSARYTYLEHLKQFQRCGENAYKLVSSGKIGVQEFSQPGKEFKEKLRKAGVKGPLLRETVRNHKEIYETFQEVQDVLKAAETGRIGLRKEELEIFKSEKVFNQIKNGKQANAVYMRLLRASDREVLRKTRFTQKTVRTMIRRAERYQLSQSEVKLLRKWLRNDRNTTYLRFTSRGFGAYVRILKNKVDEQDDAAAAGRKKIGQITFSVRATAFAFFKAGRWTSHAVGFIGRKASYGLAEGTTWTARKITGNQALNFHLICRGKAHVRKKAAEIRKDAGEKAGQIRKEAKKFQEKTVQKVRESKPGKRAAVLRSSTKEKIKKVNENFSRSKAGKFVKKTGMAAGKAGRIAKKPVKQAAKGMKVTVETFFAPLKIAGNLWAGLRRAVMIVGKYILIAVLAAAAIYILLVYLDGAMEAAVRAVRAWVEDSEENIICVEDGVTVQEWAAVLSLKDSELYSKAIELGKGTPQNPEVLYGKLIEHYGHPADGEQEASAGYMIHYIDAYGNPAMNSVSNIKDVIALCCVMFKQEMETNQASREAFRELLEDMYDLMNPELSYRESEIYTCTGNGCDNYSYFCNSDDDYKEMDVMKSEGVGFYGTIRTESGGCYCPGHSSIWSHSDGDVSCPDFDGESGSCGGHKETVYDDGCQCRGHSVLVCYGHKDVDIYIKVITKEYVFAENLIPADWELKGYAEYIREFVSEGAWGRKEFSEWASHLCQQDWYSLYGVTVGNNYGFIVDGRGPHYGGGEFCFPLADYVRISSDYGWRIHPISGDRKFHSGIDFAAVSGTAIYAAADGTVTDAGFNASMGNYVKIDHGNGLGTVYMHASALYVSAGETVEAGDVIAAVGSTGNSTGPHLHFSVTVDGAYVSPWPYLVEE